MDLFSLSFRQTAIRGLGIMLTAIFLTTSLLGQSRPSPIPQSIRNGKIPNDLEIIIGSGYGGHGYHNQSRIIIRTDRKLEFSYSCAGCLPRNPRNPLDLLNLMPHTPENQKQRREAIAKRERAERKRLATLKAQVPKKTIKAILARFKESVFFEMKPESMNCKVENFPNSGKGRWISIEFEDYSIKLAASEGCDLEDEKKTEQRKRFLALYDFIVESLANVRRNHVPWPSDIERKLRRSLEGGGMPDDFEIVAESDEGGLGSRFRIKGDRFLNKASYSARNTFVIDGAEVTHWDERNRRKRQKAPKLKRRIPKTNIRMLFSGFLSSGFFDLGPELRGDYGVTGPPKYSRISIRIDRISKQSQCATYCTSGPGPPCVEFCNLFDLIKDNVSGVKALAEPW